MTSSVTGTTRTDLRCELVRSSIRIRALGGDPNIAGVVNSGSVVDVEVPEIQGDCRAVCAKDRFSAEQ